MIKTVAQTGGAVGRRVNSCMRALWIESYSAPVSLRRKSIFLISTALPSLLVIGDLSLARAGEEDPSRSALCGVQAKFPDARTILDKIAYILHSDKRLNLNYLTNNSFKLGDREQFSGHSVANIKLEWRFSEDLPAVNNALASKSQFRMDIIPECLLIKYWEMPQGGSGTMGQMPRGNLVEFYTKYSIPNTPIVREFSFEWDKDTSAVKYIFLIER